MKKLVTTLLLASLTSFAAADSRPMKDKTADKTLAVQKDIVDTAVAAGNFKTLAKALAAAGLVETLKGKGPFTVLAPTDEAFARLPKGALDGLLKDKKKLTAVLTFHVISGAVKSAEVAKLTKAKTVNGQEVQIKAAKGAVMINGAKVTTADIETSNGVIHVIDTVLMPK